MVKSQPTEKEKKQEGNSDEEEKRARCPRQAKLWPSTWELLFFLLLLFFQVFTNLGTKNAGIFKTAYFQAILSSVGCVGLMVTQNVPTHLITGNLSSFVIIIIITIIIIIIIIMTMSRSFPITDCRHAPERAHLPGLESTMCRKVRQKGDHHHHHPMYNYQTSMNKS